MSVSTIAAGIAIIGVSILLEINERDMCEQRKKAFEIEE